MNTRIALVLIVAAFIVPPVARGGQIANIGVFLSQCPDRDPAYAQIVHDFELRKDGVLVSEPTCTEPTASIPTAQYSDALIVRQGLRVIYYMDRGQSGHLPWTSGTLYDWMKSKIGGINIVTGGGSSCCVPFGGKTFINVGSENDFNRDFDRTWPASPATSICMPTRPAMSTGFRTVRVAGPRTDATTPSIRRTSLPTAFNGG